MIGLDRQIITFLFLFVSSNNVRAENPWSFIVLADWHGAEFFALYPGPNSKTYRQHLLQLDHIHTTLGGDLVMMPGDTNTGKWHTTEFSDKIINKTNDTVLGLEETVLRAGRNCYGTVIDLFANAGYEKILVAIGDHELGGNAWRPTKNNEKNRLQPQFRQSFSNEFNKNSSTQDFLFQESIGKATSSPEGTPYNDTSYAHRHKNVLFITINAFAKVGDGTEYFIDRNHGFGGEGAITCTVRDEHLRWFELVLDEARMDASIKYIFVQSHVPVIQPVQKVSSSGQFMDGGTNSGFWNMMQKYKVDVYFAGDAHANTVTKDDTSNLLQIVSRGNMYNNLLKVEVSDNGFNITSYNENGELKSFNQNYTAHGHLTMQHLNDNTATINSSGVLKILDRSSVLVKFNFNEILPLKTRQVLGLKHDNYRISLRGIRCEEALPNRGSFGPQYDGQITNVVLVALDNGKYAGLFNETSQLAVFATGPHSGGNIISYSLRFKTGQSSSEMILVHYGPIFGTGHVSKDIFTLTLRHGNPILYRNPDSELAPTAHLTLADGKWHRVEIFMPTESCLLSEVILYVDGKVITTYATKDDNIFFTTSGRMSIGGFGYAPRNYETLFNPLNLTPYLGLMDHFKLWARPLVREFKTFKGNKCRDGVKLRGRKPYMTPASCYDACFRDRSCLGYAYWRGRERVRKCVHYGTRPKKGKSVQGVICGRAVIYMV